MGAALPSRAPPAAESVARRLLTAPTLEGLRRGRPAPRAREGHNDSIRRYTPGGPSQIRARTLSVPRAVPRLAQHTQELLRQRRASALTATGASPQTRSLNPATHPGHVQHKHLHEDHNGAVGYSQSSRLTTWYPRVSGTQRNVILEQKSSHGHVHSFLSELGKLNQFWHV